MAPLRRLLGEVDCGVRRGCPQRLHSLLPQEGPGRKADVNGGATPQQELLPRNAGEAEIGAKLLPYGVPGGPSVPTGSRPWRRHRHLLQRVGRRCGPRLRRPVFFQQHV